MLFISAKLARFASTAWANHNVATPFWQLTLVGAFVACYHVVKIGSLDGIICYSFLQLAVSLGCQRFLKHGIHEPTRATLCGGDALKLGLAFAKDSFFCKMVEAFAAE